MGDAKNMGDMSILLWGVFFGAFGLAFFVYGKRQRAIVPLVAGIALCVIPYLIDNVYILVVVGLVLMVLPYFIRI